MPVLVAEASAELGLPTAVIHEYLTECLSFELGRAEEEGLLEFFRRARALGLIDGLRQLDLPSSCDRGSDSVE